jgi:hypothetical protein
VGLYKAEGERDDEGGAEGLGWRAGQADRGGSAGE